MKLQQEQLQPVIGNDNKSNQDQQSQIEPIKRSEPKLGRNDPCHCGSGKKFKQCHGKN